MKSKILDFLRQNDHFFSGEDLSRRLGISRAAIWKHIQELKKEGYEIQAVPHQGYRLTASPDKLLPEEISYGLDTKIFAQKIFYFDTVSSTMDIAFDLASRGAPEGTIVCAEAQTKGRGRLGRHWASPKSKGLYFSIILRPKLLPNEASRLTILSGVCACKAIKEQTRLDCRIKWPNDILIGDKKVGGILTEINAETDMVRFVVIGIGMNVNSSKSNLPPKSTSLKEQLQEPVGRAGLLKQILSHLEKDYFKFQKKGFGFIKEEYKDFSVTLHKRVKVYSKDVHIEGEAVDIDDDGGLLIRKDSGFIEKVMAGDVVHCA